jgi:hypothetical protein
MWLPSIARILVGPFNYGSGIVEAMIVPDAPVGGATNLISLVAA